MDAASGHLLAKFNIFTNATQNAATAACIGLCIAQLSASRITDAKCSGSRVSYPKSAKYSRCCAIALESYNSRVLPFLCDRDHEAKALNVQRAE